MSDCYCGLKTRANRWKWTTFGVLLVVGFVFLFAAFQQIAICSRAHEIGAIQWKVFRTPLSPRQTMELSMCGSWLRSFCERLARAGFACVGRTAGATT